MGCCSAKLAEDDDMTVTSDLSSPLLSKASSPSTEAAAKVPLPHDGDKKFVEEKIETARKNTDTENIDEIEVQLRIGVDESKNPATATANENESKQQLTAGSDEEGSEEGVGTAAASSTMEVLGKDANKFPMQAVMDAELCEVDVAVTQALQGLFGLDQTMLATAVSNAKDRANELLAGGNEHGMSIDEICAIYLYTQDCIYRTLNQLLGDMDSMNLAPFFPYLKLLFLALEKLPPNAYNGALLLLLLPSSLLLLLSSSLLLLHLLHHRACQTLLPSSQSGSDKGDEDKSDLTFIQVGP